MRSAVAYLHASAHGRRDDEENAHGGPEEVLPHEALVLGARAADLRRRRPLVGIGAAEPGRRRRRRLRLGLLAAQRAEHAAAPVMLGAGRRRRSASAASLFRFHRFNHPSDCCAPHRRPTPTD